MMTRSGQVQRHYEYDWLKSIVILNLIPLHAALFVVAARGFSHINQGSALKYILVYYVGFISPLHMFLLFLISGISTCISLRFRSAISYMVERVKRLLIPLLFFMLFLYAPLSYYWPNTSTEKSVSFYFLRFWPNVLKTLYYNEKTGGPRWAHLWFVAYLFIFSMIMLPIFIYFRKEKGRELVSRLAEFSNRRAAIFIMGVPLFIIFAVLSVKWPFYKVNLYSDWAYFCYNLTAFIYGYIIFLDKRFMQIINRYGKVSLYLGIIFSLIRLTFLTHMKLASIIPSYSLYYTLYSLVAGFNTWFWMIAILSIADKRLTASNNLLKYFSNISFPFYIFHLTLMVIINYYITQWHTNMLSEFLILCFFSFIATIICCEIVKRNRTTRFLFGIKG